MDGPTRARIVLGSAAVLLAALASLALLNVLLAEPLPIGDGDGSDGGQAGGPITFQPPEPGQNESGGDGTGQGGSGGRRDPCDAGEPIVRGAALATTVIAMGLWVLAVWWRQARQTRVMNGFAIFALLVTLLATTLLFAWWIVHKVCSLDVFDLKSCLEIEHSLRNAFFVFLIVAVGLFVAAFMRLRKGGKFWGLWSIAGSMFAYLAILSLVGWIVADDLCDRKFQQPDEDDLPDGGDPDTGGNDPGGNEGGNDGGQQGQDGGGNPIGGGGPSSGGGGGGGGGAAPALPQVSPFALLAILGIAAIVTVIVLAVKGRQDQQRALAMAAMQGGRGGMLQLFSDTDIESNDAVVAAYRRFLDHCLVLGVAKKHNETPREHGMRAASKLALPYDEMLPLLDAYAHIRLADAPLPDDRRQAALSLARLWRPRTVKARRVRKRGVPGTSGDRGGQGGGRAGHGRERAGQGAERAVQGAERGGEAP